MNKTPEHDFLPLWEESSSPPETGSKGLIDQILEAGSLSRELVMPTGVYRVTTTVKFDAQQAMLFRSVVLHDEQEMTSEPWEPIFRNLTQEPADQPAKQARLNLARLALETHLQRCEAVARQLEEKGDLIPRGRISAQTYLLLLGGLLLVVGTVSAVWFWQTRTPNEIVATTALETGPIEESALLAQQEPPDGLHPDSEDPEEGSHLSAEIATIDPPPADEPLPSEAEEPSEPGPRSSPSVQEPSNKKKSTPKTASKPAPAPQTEPRKTSKDTFAPSGSSSASSPNAEAAPPRPKKEPERKPSPDQGFDSLVSSFVPQNLQVFTPKPGASIYRDPNILLSEVPSSFSGVMCVTTDNPSGDTEQGVLLVLKKSAVVLVAHDPRVKKKPSWIYNFRLTSEVLKAEEVNRGKTIEYAVYRKIFPAGAVSLGSNTDASLLTRRARKQLGLKKRVFMYLVCMTEWNPNP